MIAYASSNSLHKTLTNHILKRYIDISEDFLEWKGFSSTTIDATRSETAVVKTGLFWTSKPTG